MIVWKGRLPGASAFGWPGSRVKPSPRFCSAMPVPGTTMPRAEAHVVRLDVADHHAVAVGGAEVDRAAARRLARLPGRARASPISAAPLGGVLLVEQRRRPARRRAPGRRRSASASAKAELHRLDLEVVGLDRLARQLRRGRSPRGCSARSARRCPGRSAGSPRPRSRGSWCRSARPSCWCARPGRRASWAAGLGGEARRSRRPGRPRRSRSAPLAAIRSSVRGVVGQLRQRSPAPGAWPSRREGLEPGLELRAGQRARRAVGRAVPGAAR